MVVHANGEINRSENMRGEGRNGLGHWYHESLPGPSGVTRALIGGGGGDI